MSLARPSKNDRFFRITKALASLAPLPWLGSVVDVVKEIHDIVKTFKMVRPACEALVEKVIVIVRALEEHHRAHPGESKLESAKTELTKIVEAIRTDVRVWARFNLFQIFFGKDDILEKIDFYKEALNTAMTGLIFTGTLNQDVDSAKMNGEMKLVRSDTEEILRLIKEGADKTAAAKQAYQTAMMHSTDPDEVDDAIDRIFGLRLDEDPNSFPSEDMKGEVRKEGPEVFCYGTTFDVFKACWVDKGWVAAKRFRGRDWELSEKEKQRFRRQVNIWRTLKHANIVRLLGICQFKEEDPLYLISPWMKYGNVRHYLVKFPKADRLKLIHDVALGLQYLHSLGILHGNLNGANVLVNIDHQAKLTGFSLSKEMQEDTRRTNSNNNSELLRWWSPEALVMGPMSEQSDIWSFGMTALEILSGDHPYQDIRCPLAVRDAVLSDELPEPGDYQEEIATERIWDMMKNCWKPYGSRSDIEYITSVLRQERMKKGWNPDAPPPERLQDDEFPVAF